MLRATRLDQIERRRSRTDLWCNFPRGSATTRGLVTVGLQHGLSESAVLAATALTPGDLQLPGFEVDGCDELQAARNLVTLLGQVPGLGVASARHLSFSCLGTLGLALMSASSVREAVRLGIDMKGMTFALVEPIYIENNSHEQVLLHDAHIPADIRHLIVERDLTTFCRAWPLVTGRTNGVQIQAALGDVAINHLRAALPGFHIKRGERTMLHIDRRVLDSPTAQADPETFRDLLCALESQIQRRRGGRGLSERIRARIVATPDSPPTMEDLAHALHIDVRTLRRRLTSEGTSYRNLINEIRRSQAATLLADSALTVEAVADKLGYHDAAGLSKAFRRWYGETPSSFRARQDRQ
nr:AraC family transcriptional regulator [Aldersonia kunmingensis]